MNITCHIEHPLYVHNNKTYIDVSLDQQDMSKIRAIHDDSIYKLRAKIVQDPLQGNILKVKVPTRNGKTLCAVTGLKPLCAMSKGDQVDIKISFCGAWNYGDFCGWAWKLSQACLTTTDYL